MQRLRARTKSFDYPLAAIIFALFVIGLAIVYSASTVLSYTKYQTNTYYFFHQLLYGVAIGLPLMYICSKIDYHKWQKYAPLLIIISIGLLMVVLLPHIGLKVGNSRRWINLGLTSIQPAEIVKLTLIFYLASWIDKRSEHIKDFYYGVIPSLVIIGLIAGLILLEPDMGTMIVVIVTALVMLFVGGTRIKHLVWIFALGIAALLVLVKLEPYRVARFTTFLNPSLDPQGIGYQINQALLAAGSGGFWGYGYGHSRQKYNFLPEVMGDSVFAITVEELGFLRSTLIIGLFLLLAARGLKIARGVPDLFGKMVAVGIVAWISFQALINIGAIIGVLPLTGIPLPFVSYGSSALIVTLAAMGVLLNISKHSTI